MSVNPLKDSKPDWDLQRGVKWDVSTRAWGRGNGGLVESTKNQITWGHHFNILCVILVEASEKRRKKKKKRAKEI